MSFKSNINPSSRTVVVSPNGDDNESGQGPETAVKTIANAIAKINALVPPPGSDASDFSLIQIIGAGQFTEPNLIFPTGCQVNAENTFLFPTGNGVTPGNVTSMNISIVFTVAENAKAFTYINALTIGVQSLGAITVGANSFCTHVSGSCKELYIKIDQMRIGGEGSVGLLNNCDEGDPLTATVDNMILNANNTTGMLHSHDTLNLMKTSIKLISIVEEVGLSLTGTIGVDIQRGLCSMIASNIEAETAIHVSAGAELNVTASLVVGDIIVDSGGMLRCNIANFDLATGSIVINGTIKGQIGDFMYGDEPRLVDSSTSGDDLVIKNGEDIVIGILTGVILLTIDTNTKIFTVRDKDENILPVSKEVTITLSGGDSLTLGFKNDYVIVSQDEVTDDWSFYNYRNGKGELI